MSLVSPPPVLTAPPALGLATREAFRTAAEALLTDPSIGEGPLVIDFSGTTAVDSSGLGVLVLIQRQAAERRLPVVLRGLGQEFEYLLVLTRLDDLFQFERPAAAG